MYIEPAYYSHNIRCKCGKLVTNKAKTCLVCYRLSLKGKGNPMFGKKRKLWGLKYSGKNHPRWKGGLPKCIDCGKALSNYTYRNNRCKSCSQKGKLNNYIYKPEGTKIIKNGYIFIKHNNKWIQEHRLKAEKYIGRKLKQQETIHHIDGNKQNNKLRNLYLFCNGIQHSKFEYLVRTKKINRDTLKSNLRYL